MLIGKPGPAKTAICTATADSITVHGRDLTNDLMGRQTFTEFFYLLMTGREPDKRQAFFLDLLLIAIAEHGLTPTPVAARMTYAAAPDSLQGAVAAGVLGCGNVILGATGRCANVLADINERIATGIEPQDAIAGAVREIRERGEAMPGFGHPIHHPLDPRAERILALADQHGLKGGHLDLARRIVPVVAREWGKPLPMNVSMAIAACLLDLDFPPTMTKAIPLLSRVAGLLGHIAEEEQRPIGFLLAARGSEAIAYDGPKVAR